MKHSIILLLITITSALSSCSEKEYSKPPRDGNLHAWLSDEHWETQNFSFYVHHLESNHRFCMDEGLSFSGVNIKASNKLFGFTGGTDDNESYLPYFRIDLPGGVPSEQELIYIDENSEGKIEMKGSGDDYKNTRNNSYELDLTGFSGNSNELNTIIVNGRFEELVEGKYVARSVEMKYSFILR